MKRERRKREKERTKMSELYSEEPLEERKERKPSPWAGKFSIKGPVCQPCPVTDGD